jgi:hypothetical protein
MDFFKRKGSRCIFEKKIKERAAGVFLKKLKKGQQAYF